MRAKKSLGQNFLKSLKAAEALVNAADIKNTDTIVEIGPGKGIITEFLLQKAQKIIAVEKDDRMIFHLKEKFPKEISSKKLILVHDDILYFKPSDWKLKTGSWKLVGSIPFYITGIFLRTFLSIAKQPKTIAIILQKEVAKRIVTKNKKESILSISVKAFGVPHYIQTIPRKYFSPEPKVDSAIITIENISREFFTHISEDMFFSIVKSGFHSKRKKLLNNIQLVSKETLRNIFKKLNISSDIRAEDLTLEQWKTLSNELKSSAPYQGRALVIICLSHGK